MAHLVVAPEQADSDLEYARAPKDQAAKATYSRLFKRSEVAPRVIWSSAPRQSSSTLPVWGGT